jgi:hypothetical protein
MTARGVVGRASVRRRSSLQFGLARSTAAVGAGLNSGALTVARTFKMRFASGMSLRANIGIFRPATVG